MKRYYLDSREVDRTTLSVTDVNMSDYPDFSDAWVDSASFVDGGELSEDELNEFTDSYPEVVNELAHEVARETSISHLGV